jgi:hypothetical protein
LDPGSEQKDVNTIMTLSGSTKQNFLSSSAATARTISINPSFIEIVRRMKMKVPGGPSLTRDPKREVQNLKLKYVGLGNQEI